MLKSSAKLNFFGLILTIFIFFITSLSAQAKQNVVSSVLLANAKGETQGYELDIDSSQAVNYKIKTVGENNIIFELKNSILDKNPQTFYNDVKGIESVIVKQYGRNKVRIFIQGQNVENTELVFINSIFEQPKDPKSIIINRPINQYQSTDTSSDLDNQEENQNWDDNSFNFLHLLSAILDNLKDGAMGIVMIFAFVFVILLNVIRYISKNYSQDLDPLIGLNNVKASKNVPDGYSENIADSSLTGIKSRSETIKKAQIELQKAHQKYQTYLQNKYSNQTKQKTSFVDPLKRNLALNQYQKNNKNPYLNQEVIKLNDVNKFQSKDSFQIPPRPKKEINKSFSSPYIQRETNKIDYIKKPSSNTPNMRFLESVTKIYEQSGRGDLANGLKNTISKSKQSI